jgi:hypothetical protein
MLYSERGNFIGADDWKGTYYRLDDETILTQRQYTKYHNGKLVETEMNVRIGRLFSVDEILSLLSKSVFKLISVTDLVSDNPVNENSEIATFTCTK